MYFHWFSMYFNLWIMSRRYCVSQKKKVTWYKPSKAGFSGWKGKLTGIYGGLLSYYACALRTLRPVCYLTQWVQSLYKYEFFKHKQIAYASKSLSIIMFCCFCLTFETKLDNSVHTRSNQIKLVQIRSNKIQFDQIGSNQIKLDQIDYLVQIISNWFKSD